MEYLKASESFRSTVLNDSQMNTCSFTWAIVAPTACVCSAAVVSGHLESSAKGSYTERLTVLYSEQCNNERRKFDKCCS